MNRDPWTSYWASAEGSGGAGCLPNAASTVAPLLDRMWRDFAAGLPRRARVLDLATGNGAVMRTLHAIRPDLDLTGIDSAAALPAAPSWARLVGGVSIEEIPWPAESFDAATSQFGIEYSDTAKAAAEAGRVLRRGGALRLLLHHKRSIVVTHNLARRDALAWSARDSGLLDKARKLAGARRIARLPTPDGFRAVVREAQARYPAQPVAAEFASAVLQSLEMGAARPAGETLEVLEILQQRSRDELGRLNALEAAACDHVDARRIVNELTETGLVATEPRELRNDAGSEPVAWLIDASRP